MPVTDIDTEEAHDPSQRHRDSQNLWLQTRTHDDAMLRLILPWRDGAMCASQHKVVNRLSGWLILTPDSVQHKKRVAV